MRSNVQDVSKGHILTLLALSKIDGLAKQMSKMRRRVTLTRSLAHITLLTPTASSYNLSASGSNVNNNTPGLFPASNDPKLSSIPNACAPLIVAHCSRVSNGMKD